MNCQGNHTANDAANCPAFKKAIELKDNKQKSHLKSNIPQQTNKKPLNVTTQSRTENVKRNLPQNNAWSVVQSKSKTNKSVNKDIDQYTQ